MKQFNILHDNGCKGYTCWVSHIALTIILFKQMKVDTFGVNVCGSVSKSIFQNKVYRVATVLGKSSFALEKVFVDAFSALCILLSVNFDDSDKNEH